MALGRMRTKLLLSPDVDDIQQARQLKAVFDGRHVATPSFQQRLPGDRTGSKAWSRTRVTAGLVFLREGRDRGVFGFGIEQ